MKDQTKEKEQAEKLRELRREIEEKLQEQLPAEIISDRPRVEVERINEDEVLDPARAKQIIEALLFASSKPLTIPEIRKVAKQLKPGEIEKIITDLQSEYAQTGRSFEIREIAGGYEIATRKEFAPWLFKLEVQKKARQATQSALETIAILAYKQPITRAEIEELRGVDVSGVLNTLMARGLIKIVGKKEVPGRPFLYATTEKFLEHFGLKALTDLPNIEEIKTMVESSVKKDELIGTAKIVEVPQETEAPPETEQEEQHESESNPQEN